MNYPKRFLATLCLMAETATKRLAFLALLFLVSGIGLLSWWSWQGLEEDLNSENRRIRRVEQMGLTQVVNNLGSELFHLHFTFNLGIAQAVGQGTDDWPRSVESIVGTYRAQAHYPELLTDVVLVADPPVGSRRWISWSSDGWVAGGRPDWIPSGMTLFDLPPDPMVDLESPILVFSLPSSKELRQVLVVRYSVDILLKVIVPALVREAFATRTEVPGYHVEVVREATGPGAAETPPADVMVPLIPRVRFAEWLRNYLDRTLEAPRTPREYYAPGARWALGVSLKPAGLEAYTEEVRSRNLLLVGSLVLVLGVGFGLVLLSIGRILRASQREKAFSSLISHELKTPLAAIRSLSENLADGLVASPERTREYGAQLLEQTGRLGGLVSNILSLSLLDGPAGRLRRETFDAAILAREVAARTGLPVGIGEGPWLVRGNRAALEAALDNLVTNALKYGTREGERPSVALGLHRARQWGVRWVGISVTDHGPGVDKAELKALFQPYRRGRRASLEQIPGGGIGLSLVRATMRHLDGRVQVRPVPGGGLTFRLWLKEGGEG